MYDRARQSETRAERYSQMMLIFLIAESSFYERITSDEREYHNRLASFSLVNQRGEGR